MDASAIVHDFKASIVRDAGIIENARTSLENAGQIHIQRCISADVPASAAAVVDNIYIECATHQYAGCGDIQCSIRSNRATIGTGSIDTASVRSEERRVGKECRAW